MSLPRYPEYKDSGAEWLVLLCQIPVKSSESVM